MVATLLSGFLLPIKMWPEWLQQIVYVLPFASMVSIPIDVMLGKLQGVELIAALALQVFWTVVMLAIGRQVLSTALHKLVVQGG
jgi:ABC-2 type transport system permease protein